MNIPVPSREMFDSWNLKTKWHWLEMERQDRPLTLGIPGYLFFKTYAIRYLYNNEGTLIEAITMEPKQAAQEVVDLTDRLDERGN